MQEYFKDDIGKIEKVGRQGERNERRGRMMKGGEVLGEGGGDPL